MFTPADTGLRAGSERSKISKSLMFECGIKKVGEQATEGGEAGSFTEPFEANEKEASRNRLFCNSNTSRRSFRALFSIASLSSRSLTRCSSC